jgi:fructosamine-3-kinase
MKEIIEQIADRQSWKVKSVAPVHGGDINQAFAIETTAGKYFIKLNSANRYPRMFEIEAAGLKALAGNYPLKVPQVIDCGVAADQQYLILEWLAVAQATSASWEAFGIALAELHRTTNESFGWEDDNYLGSLKMTNSRSESWPEFYASKRIMPMVKQLRDNSAFSENDVQMAEQFCKRLPDIIPAESPALLHGDLWNGNVSAVMMDGKITTAIYDPSVFYGHREIDIALTKLFGGFPAGFYDSYQQAYPLEKGWQQRLPVFQLSHLLLHAVLFGGGYISSVKSIIRSI